MCYSLCDALLQDVVTRGGKFLFLYKRPGNRVIVNGLGHMMVSPSSLEASVQQYTAGDIAFCILAFCVKASLSKVWDRASPLRHQYSNTLHVALLCESGNVIRLLSKGPEQCKPGNKGLACVRLSL